MGDPETQPILSRMKSDWVPVIEAAIDGKLNTVEIEWDRRVALGVVVAAHNYPQTPRAGDAISGLSKNGNHKASDSFVFHAGTQLENNQVVTSGGRVLCVTALADSTKLAQQKAYLALDQIRFDGMQFRKDIGHLAISRKR